MAVKIRIQLPGVRLGIVEARGITVTPTGAEQAREMDEVCEHLRRTMTVESLAGAEAVVAVRGMFRRWGVDPSKYRPSSEALLRRVIQGKGLYRVSNVVDACNLGSIETGWPYGLYNWAAIGGSIQLRLGATGEKYEGIGRRIWHLGGRPVLADAQGPFGSPISDSTRTQIEEGVSEVLTVIFAPPSASENAMRAAMETQARRLCTYAGASPAGLEIMG